MRAIFKPCTLCGNIDAPPSKSMAHRYLIGASLSGEKCQLSGVDYSEDILASVDCLRALGAEIGVENDIVTIHSEEFMKSLNNPVLKCRESGSTLRFFIPLALCLGSEVILQGSKRLFERPLNVYEELCREHHFTFESEVDYVRVCGNLRSGTYRIRGDISSQFITGLIFALIYRGEESCIQIVPPFESRSYVNLTIEALKSFGADIKFADEYQITIGKAEWKSYKGSVEGDYSNAAFLDAFNYIGSEITVHNLREESLQGNRVYQEYFEQIANGTPILDLSDCPDLGPVLFAMAAMKNGATFTGTDRLKAKESDRGMAMHEELKKLGGGLIFGDNYIVVPKQELEYKGEPLDGHNDHRIVMAMAIILSKTGGVIEGVEAVRKSYPGFFTDIMKLGAEVELE